MTGLTELAAAVVARFAERGLTIATAESLTAGLICATIADIPGASRVLLGGIVSYDPRIKREMLNVSQSVIDGVGVVSEPCARQMAEGARAALRADIAVSATGVAGPSGGTSNAPVGTVYIACAGKQGTVARQFRFTGDRQAVRWQAVESALQLVLETIEA
jgi:nicotinamide-nucleotide amidase